MAAREAATQGRTISGARAHRPPAPLVLTALSAACIAAVVLATAVGSTSLPLSQEVLILARALGMPVAQSWPDSARAILMDLRLPRVLGALAAGAGLAAAGALMQGLFRNPLADPYVLGSSSGAGLGAILAMALSLRWSFLGFGAVAALAFAGALGSILLVYLIARVGWRTPATHLLLAGVAVGSLLAALMSFVMLFSSAIQTQLRSAFVWLLGGVSLSGWDELRMVLPMVSVAVLLSMGLARPLDALSLGEEAAAHLGVPIERSKLLAIAAAALLTALSVSISGLIGFVGLVIPHAVRLVIGPAHRLLIPASALAGGCFLVLADLAARTIIAPNEVPVGIITAFLGAPFFLYLLKRRGGGYEL